MFAGLDTRIVRFSIDCCSLMERAVQVQFLAFLTVHDLLSVNQSGFRKKHSPETATVYLTDYILDHMDRQMSTGAVFIDLKKAFDLVDHECLDTME